jgi:hypothetical protein
MKKIIFPAFCLLLSTSMVHAVTLVQTSDSGFYNNSIGNLLDLSNTGIDDANEPFPIDDDSNTSFSTAPNLSAASSILGNWLSDPLNLNSNWSSSPISVPNSWIPGTEVAVIYQFDTLSATNVVASFGVDNGIFVWLDGNYLFGARAAGGSILGEYTLNLGDFAAGTHFLQILLEDHGGSNGYDVQITADSFISGAIPEPGTGGLMVLGFSLLLRNKRNSEHSSALSLSRLPA